MSTKLPPVRSRADMTRADKAAEAAAIAASVATAKRPPTIGGETVLVPLAGGDGKQIARVARADFNRLMANGISPNWALTSTGKAVGRADTVKVRVGRKVESVARLILQPKWTEKVAFLTEDRTDLRRTNIVTEKKKAPRSLPSTQYRHGGKVEPNKARVREMLFAVGLTAEALFAALVAEKATRWEAEGLNHEAEARKLAREFGLTDTGLVASYPKAPRGSDPRHFEGRFFGAVREWAKPNAKRPPDEAKVGAKAKPPRLSAAERADAERAYLEAQAASSERIANARRWIAEQVAEGVDPAVAEEQGKAMARADRQAYCEQYRLDPATLRPLI